MFYILFIFISSRQKNTKKSGKNSAKPLKNKGASRNANVYCNFNTYVYGNERRKVLIIINRQNEKSVRIVFSMQGYHQKNRKKDIV